MRLKKKQDSIRIYNRIVKTVCGECFVGCGLKFFLQDNQVVDMAGDEDHPINKGSICPRGAKIMEKLSGHGNSLLQYPMKKAGFNDAYKRISWEEGVDHVACRLAEIKEEFGPDALTILISKPGNFSNYCLGLRFAKLFGTSKAAAYDPMKPASELARLALGGFKGTLSNPPHDWINSKVILVLGSEIASEVILMGYLLDAKERGAKIICVDTKYTQVMTKADFPILIKPGTFHLFMYGIVNKIISEGQYDNQLLARWTEGFSEIMKASMSYDQIPISELCGVQSEIIPKLSALLTLNHPIQVIGSVRDDQVNGPDGLARLAWLSIILLAMNNSLGVKGGGWNWLGTGSPPLAFDGDIEEGRADDHCCALVEWQQDYGRLLEEIIEKDTCQALIWDGHIPDEFFSQELIEALSKLKLVVHLSDQENLAGKYAHVSFPVTNWLEEEGPVFCSHHRAIQWRNQVYQTPGERKPAGLFWLRLAEKMGYGQWFPWRDNDNSIDIVSAANFFVQQTNSLSGFASLANTDLTGGGILWPHLSGQEAEFADKALIKGRWLLYKYDEEYPGTDRSFPTDSGRIRLSGKAYQEAGWGVSPFGPIETGQQASSPPAYSLVYTSAPGFLGDAGRIIDGRYVIGVNPAHAEELEIRDGDRILLEKGNGETFEAQAWVTDKIALHTVGLVDLEEPSYYASFCYRKGWVEGIPVNVKKLVAGKK